MHTDSQQLYVSRPTAGEGEGNGGGGYEAEWTVSSRDTATRPPISSPGRRFAVTAHRAGTYTIAPSFYPGVRRAGNNERNRSNEEQAFGQSVCVLGGSCWTGGLSPPSRWSAAQRGAGSQPPASRR